METMCDRYRSGRLAFVGPDPDTGVFLFVRTEHGLRDYKYIERDGTLTLSIIKNMIDPAVWKRIAGEY
jgi:hypothetical protein